MQVTPAVKEIARRILEDFPEGISDIETLAEIIDGIISQTVTATIEEIQENLVVIRYGDNKDQWN